MNMKPVMLMLLGAASATLYGCGGLHAAKDAGTEPDAATATAAPPAATDSAAPAPAAADAAPAAAPVAIAAPAPSTTAAASPDTDAPTPSVPDGTLTTRVRSALAKHYNLGAAHIKVSTHEGVVHLSGAVASSVQIDQAESVVGAVDGVLEVDNQLKVGRAAK